LTDVLKPSLSLLVKLGSIAVHTEEMLSKDGHAFDRHALDTALNDPEVLEWRKGMDKLALIPRKRKP
jgi:hypothetical protein